MPHWLSSSSWQLKLLTPFFIITNYFLTTGIIYGWAGLQRQLKDEGLFRSGCDSGTGPCDSQDNDLNTIATVAFNMANLATVVHGFTLDNYGVRINAIIGGIIFTLGMIGMSATASLALLVVAFTAVGWGGIAIFLSSFQFANLFTRSNLMRSIINALFTAAGLIFTVIQYLDQRGYHRGEVFGIYAAFAGVMTVGIALLFPAKPYQSGDECSLPVVEWITGYAPIRQSDKQRDSDGDADSESGESITSNDSGKVNGVEKTGLLSDKDCDSHAINTISSDSHSYSIDSNGSDSHDVSEATSVANDMLHDPTTGAPLTEHHHAHESHEDREHAKNTATLLSEIKDRQTLYLSLFFSFGLLFSNWFNATIAIQLTAMGDSDGYWAVVFIMVASFLPIPCAVLIDWLIKRYQYSGTVLVCAISLMVSYLPLFIASLPLQLLSFLFYTIARAIIVTVMFTFCATQYRHDHYGRLVAVVTIIAFPIGFLQLLMQRLVTTLSYQTMNGVCIVAFAPCLLYYHWLRNRRI